MSETELLLRRQYVEAECYEAGLDEQQTELVVAAAMSAAADPIYDDDDWETLVQACIEGSVDSDTL